MNRINTKMRQVVDWRAAVWAGVISGVVFLLISMLLASVYIGSPWVITRLIASIIMGPDVLPPLPPLMQQSLSCQSLLI